MKSTLVLGVKTICLHDCHGGDGPCGRSHSRDSDGFDHKRYDLYRARNYRVDYYSQLGPTQKEVFFPYYVNFTVMVLPKTSVVSFSS